MAKKRDENSSDEDENGVQVESDEDEATSRRPQPSLAVNRNRAGEKRILIAEGKKSFFFRRRFLEIFIELKFIPLCVCRKLACAMKWS